jgi:hypothetical protein
MTNPTVTAGSTPAPLSLPARFVGIITSPKATFQAVVAYPKWFGMLALVSVAVAVLVGGFLSTAVGQAAWLEMATAGMDDARYEGMLRFAKYVGVLGAIQMLVMIPVMTLITAGILYVGFNAMGGDASFKQVFTVVTHASAVSVLGQLFTVPVNYAREKMASATNLISLLPMIDEKSFLGRLFAMIDVFLIWWVLVLAMGLAVLYRRRTQPIALTLFGIYAVIALVAAAVMSRLGGA